MFRTLIASLTPRKPPAPIFAPAAASPTLALVPVSTERVRGYDYGRTEIRRKAMQARTVDRAWQ